MRYIVQPGDSLWSIAQTILGDGSKWKKIATTNNIQNPAIILVGQELVLDDSSTVGLKTQINSSTSRLGVGYPSAQHSEPTLGSPESFSSLIPAVNYVFVLADEINPLNQKVVRRVITNPKMAAELARELGRPIDVFPNPERFGFQVTDPNSSVSPGRHARGMKPSSYSSASTKKLGASRFAGKPFWIDVEKAKAAGSTIHSTQDVLNDLDRIIGKTKSADGIQKLKVVKGLVQADAEVLFKGNVASSAVKGPMAMSSTRVLQGVQIIGFTMSAVNMAHATEKSINTQSANPVVAESIRQAGGWTAAWAGIKLGGAGGALLGIETGPGLIITGAIGSVAGGVAGYYGFDWIADHIDEN